MVLWYVACGIIWQDGQIMSSLCFCSSYYRLLVCGDPCCCGEAEDSWSDCEDEEAAGRHPGRGRARCFSRCAYKDCTDSAPSPPPPYEAPPPYSVAVGLDTAGDPVTL